MDGWYGASRQSLRDGIRLLTHVKTDFEANHVFRDESKEAVAKAFGPDFVELLTKWRPTDYQTVLLARMLTYKHREYQTGLPVDLEEGAKKYIIDPEQGTEMFVKLLEERLMFLQELRRFLDQKWATASAQEAVGVVVARAISRA